MMQLNRQPILSRIILFCSILSTGYVMWAFVAKQDNYERFTNNNMKTSKNIVQTVCKQNKEHVDLIKNVDLDNSSYDQMRNLFYKFITRVNEGTCYSWLRLGGVFLPSKCHDGHKYVCLNQNLKREIEDGKCIVYSFGIRNEWSFEKEVRNLGCNVLTFDPSVEHPNELDKNITFEKIGLGRFIAGNHVDEKTMTTFITKPLKTIIEDNGHLYRTQILRT